MNGAPGELSLGRTLAGDFLGWFGRRTFEVLAWALAFWVVSLQSRDFGFLDYFGSASAIGFSAGIGCAIRTVTPAGNYWPTQFLRQVALMVVVLALFAAIFEMPAMLHFWTFLCG